MTDRIHNKITATHLKRDAYLYVRQSTIRQVFENTESTRRQYALRERAIAMGWPAERIIVIDTDLGQSGASTADREGFQRLVTEVSMGRAGVVMGLEVSRLARNSTDWHRLLEICALAETLILDEDGLYDPSHFNDRLLLGLKGTMSEAELYQMRARLIGGQLSKARRGELKLPLPVGYVYNEVNQVVFDPDQQVQKSLHLFFETFRRTGSATATVKAFRSDGHLLPRRIRRGIHKGELHWGELVHSRALQILHNPRYAGAYVYGKVQQRRKADGSIKYHKQSRDNWITLLPDSHEGYISWEEYERNQKQLRDNAKSYGYDRRKSPPREGPALLQGIVLCARCGRRMTVRYHTRNHECVPDYVCQRDGIETGNPICQIVPGYQVEQAIGELVVESMTPMALGVALSVDAELKTRAEEADALRRGQVERARYEAELCRRRYLHVDPENRLVADALEADWNAHLRQLAEAEEAYDQWRRRRSNLIDEKKRSEILALATDFPRLWKSKETSHRERKRLIRLIIEDVALKKSDQIGIHVRFKGGALRTINVDLPGVFRKTPPEVVKQVNKLLDDYIESEVADILNARGVLSGDGKRFDVLKVRHIRYAYHLKSRQDRLRARGLLSLTEIADLLDIHPCTVKKWHRLGVLHGTAFNEGNECLYELPGPDWSTKKTERKPEHRRIGTNVLPSKQHEVQYAT